MQRVIQKILIGLFMSLLTLVAVGTGVASADPSSDTPAPSSPPTSGTDSPPGEWAPTENPKPFGHPRTNAV